MRQPKPITLANLDPQRTAEELVWALYARARRDATLLGLVLKVEPLPSGVDPRAALNATLDKSRFSRLARVWAEWAMVGKGRPEEMGSALRELRAAIDGVEPGEALQRELWDLTPTARLLLVAGATRLALAEDRTVEATEVATLASVDDRTIRAAVKAGTLKPVGEGRPMRFAPEVVRRYLYERGVLGFETTQPGGPV